MPADQDILQQLDWQTVQCQCEQLGCQGHCPHAATVTVEFHALDHCNTKTTDPDINMFGNYTFLLCHGCLQSLTIAVSRHLVPRNMFGQHTCQTCGAPAATNLDVIREVRAL